MSATVAILIRPVTGFSHARFRNSTVASAITVYFSPRKSVYWSSMTRRPNSMNGPVSARNDDVGLASLEQEALVDGSKGLGLGASGIEATLNKQSKWLFSAIFGIILIGRHDALAIWASIGSILNSALSHVLKRILNQKRPVTTSRSDPGMPSSHAQSIFYIVTFAIVSMAQSFQSTGVTAALGGLILAIGCYFSWLRISQKLHTIGQVLVGATIGLGFSIFWFWLWDAIMLKAFISLFWVRIIVIVGAAVFCLSFLRYVIRNWVLDEQ